MDDLDTISVNAYTLNEYPTLPYNGWIKVCTNKNCRTITGRFLIYDFNRHKFKFYFCPPCKKNFNCIHYIEKYYTKYMDKATTEEVVYL